MIPAILTLPRPRNDSDYWETEELSDHLIMYYAEALREEEARIEASHDAAQAAADRAWAAHFA